jgi:hypothetical protein
MGGSSSSAQTTAQTDNRRSIAQGAISNEGGSVNVLDGGAIGNAFNFADNVADRAMVANAQATYNALDFGDSALSKSMQTTANALSFATNANDSAMDVVGSSTRRVLDFATTANAQALDSLSATASFVKDSYADAKGRGAMTDKILIGSVVMAGLVALAAIRK